MDQTIIRAINLALDKVNHQRFFESERGFQGEFKSNLKAELGIGLQADTIIEDEHQKRLKDHGLRLRPDLIIHVPYDETTNSKLHSTGNRTT